MIRVISVVAILLAGNAASLLAQDGAVRGHVVRADARIPVADAEIELRPSGARALTDAQGFFVLRGLALGLVELHVRRVGFTPAVLALRVDSVKVTEVEILLQPVATTLEPLVTTFTRDPRSLSEVAAAVSVADTSVIRRNRTIGLHEPLRTMPGVQVASRYGTDDVNIGIRGSAARTRQAVRGVAVLLDGIPLTEPDGVTRLDVIELTALRQVEVVRGPASALYAGSPSGVVNVVSRGGRDSRGVSTHASAGGFGFHKYDGHAGEVFAGGRGSGFAAASYTSADGYRSHSDGEILRGHLALDYNPAPGTKVAFQANGSRLNLRLPGSQTQDQFDADPDAAAPAALAFGFGRADDRYRAGVRVEQQAGNGSASGYIFYGGRTLDFPVVGTIVDFNLHRVQGGARLRAGRVAGSALDATIGLDYDNLFGTDQRWQNVGGVRGALVNEGYLSAPNLGAYSQIEWRASASAGVTLGLRYDHVTYRFEGYTPGSIPKQETTFDQLSPRLSTVWNSDSATSLYASVGRGVEVPTIGEMSAYSGAPLSQSLHPKSLWNFELGARRRVGGRVLVDGSVFYADVRGEFVPRTIDNRSRPENAGRSRNIGIELGVTARATKHLDLVAGYTLLDLRLRSYTTALLDSSGAFQPVDFAGKLIPGVPRHRITGEARVSPVTALDLGLQIEWQSIVYVESGNAATGVWYFQPVPDGPVQQVEFRAAPARALVHLNATWRLGPATLFGSVENLFGLRYPGNILANESLGRFYEAGPPSSVSLGFQVTGWSKGF